MQWRILVSSAVAAAAVAIGLTSIPLWLQATIIFLLVFIAQKRPTADLTLTKEPLGARLLRIAPFLSVAMLVLIAANLVASIFWSVLYVVITWLQQQPLAQTQQQLARTGLNQLLMFWAIFTAAALLGWHPLAIIILAWLAAYGSTYKLLSDIGERAAKALSAAWALVVAELSWVFSLWLVNYVFLDGRIIVPQAAIVMTALGYCFGGIYFAHRQSSLSWGRLMEYLLIGLSLMVIVIAGTKWSGTI